MGKPAAFLTSHHICPKTTGNVPHVGGPVLAASANVFIGGMPAAKQGDTAVCVGPPDTISEGSASVFINGKPAARVGDGTAHGGKIVIGNPSVMIGDAGVVVNPNVAPSVSGLAAEASSARIYGGRPTSCGGRDSSTPKLFTDPKSVNEVNNPARKPKVFDNGTVSPLPGTKANESPKRITKFKERGQVVTREFEGSTYTLRKDENGFPEFTIFETHLSDDHLGSGDCSAHFAASNRRLGELLREEPALIADMGFTQQQADHIMATPAPVEPPPGLTWHHHEDVGRMQLVDRELHARFGHTGGMFIWGGGRD